MRKHKTRRVLVVVGAIIMLIGLLFIYLSKRNRNLSPPGDAKLTNGPLTVAVAYSRPSVRDRLIFGPEKKGALQPWGKYWRLGANEATEISFNTDVVFGGEKVGKGRYKMYAMPGEKSFDIILNTSLGDWGYSEPDHEEDVLKVNVPVEKLKDVVEQMTIRLEKIGASEIDLIIEFADVRLILPIKSGS